MTEIRQRRIKSETVERTYFLLYKIHQKRSIPTPNTSLSRQHFTFYVGVLLFFLNLLYYLFADKKDTTQDVK